MLQHLTRAVTLLEDAEFTARQEAEQLAKTLSELREHLAQLQDLEDQSWTQENYAVELTRALTNIENARMEYNAARLKWPLLSGANPANTATGATTPSPGPDLANLSFKTLCRVGLALTWPLVLVVVLAAIAFGLAWFLTLR
jgi:hypothetical protein